MTVCVMSDGAQYAHTHKHSNQYNRIFTMGGGSKRKKKKTQPAQEAAESAEIENTPRSMVFKRGKVGLAVATLVKNLRVALSPNSASNLKESKKNSMKDFLALASPLGITHFLTLTQTNFGVNLRVMRTPAGPTLTFRVEGYSLMSDIANLQKRPHSPGSEFMHPPLLVLNNFSGKEEEKQIMSVMFQNLFPALDVKNIKLSQCRRVILINRDKEGMITFRHYVINASPVGLTKSVKAIIKGKTPDLSNRQDIEDWVLNPGQMSDSELEDTPESRVELSQRVPGRGNKEKQKSAIRLKEVGPRMALKLVKIEQDLIGGRVIYHDHVIKSEEEVERLKKEKADARMLKKSRKTEQEKNLKKKELAKKKRKRDNEKGDDEGSDSDHVEGPTSMQQDAESDDDEAYYREAVGSAPERGLFAKKERGERGEKRQKRDDGDRTERGGKKGGKGGKGKGSRKGGDEDGEKKKEFVKFKGKPRTGGGKKGGKGKGKGGKGGKSKGGGKGGKGR